MWLPWGNNLVSAKEARILRIIQRSQLLKPLADHASTSFGCLIRRSPGTPIPCRSGILVERDLVTQLSKSRKN